MLMPLSISALPSTYKLNYYLTGLLRLIQGICAVRHVSSSATHSMHLTQGCAFPASHGILANWCPPCERGRMGGFIYTGKTISEDLNSNETQRVYRGLYAGPVVGFFLSGILIKYTGHSSIYYGSGE